MANIVFILNNISHPHCHRRISEFIDNGFNVKVYGFARNGNEIPYKNDLYNSNLLASIDQRNYIKRLSVLFKGIRQVINESNQDDILYLFGLDIAMFSSIQKRKLSFIYEEADLVHTYIKNNIIKSIFEKIDLKIMKKSLLTILTSEGFARYHFGNSIPANISLITNRLNPAVLNIKPKYKNKIDINQINFGFAGSIRFKSIYLFAEHIGKYYPQHIFHFFGTCNKKEINLFNKLKKYQNIIFHGVFSNPSDLPSIYSMIDFVVATYDSEFENVRYAEPNKLYEAIYFDTPIIVSENTFLAEKVKNMGVGFSVNVENPESLDNFIKSISETKINNTVKQINTISKINVINNNVDFFKSLKVRLENT